MGWVGVDQEKLWVLQARQGDQVAFSRLVEVYQTPIYNLAYRMLGNGAEAEDATQETFVRVWTKLDSYDLNRKLSSWILSVASHHCIDRLRRRRGNQVSMEEIQSWRWLPDDKPRPEERTMMGEKADKIRQLLGQLPSQYRLVITLRYWQDRSYAEIAEITGTTESAVKSRLHRARRAMAELLATSDIDPAAAQAMMGG